MKPSSTAADLYAQLAAESGLSIHRLRITKGDDNSIVPNSRDVTIDELSLGNQSIIQVKDLGKHAEEEYGRTLKLKTLAGPQIAWRTVFIIEYLGPLLIHPLVYALQPYLSSYSTSARLQTVSMWMISLHFFKRELETVFVHRFSSSTMPIFNIFKNSGHYWVFAGLNIAYWVYLSSSSPAARPSNPLITYPALALYIVGELGNLQTHLTLRGLRSTGGKERGIPQGLGFDWVTCPNYMFETMAWVGIWMVTWSLSTGIFVALAVGQMAIWAKKKESRYRKEFGDRYQKKRFAMIPGIW